MLRSGAVGLVLVLMCGPSDCQAAELERQKWALVDLIDCVNQLIGVQTGWCAGVCTEGEQ